MTRTFVQSSRGRRLLLPREAMIELHKRWTMGVPMTRLIKTLDVDIAHLVLTKLIKAYDQSLQEKPDLATVMQASLFPIWLDNAEYQDTSDYWANALQQTPVEKKYVGYFPLGHWENGDTEGRNEIN